METKGEVTDDSCQDVSTIFYQCPKCKNVEIYAKPIQSRIEDELPLKPQAYAEPNKRESY